MMADRRVTSSRGPAAPTPSARPRGDVLQRCSCGGTPGPSGECAECRRRRKLGLQAKLMVNAVGDRWEREADRVADRAARSSAPTGPEVADAHPRRPALQASPVGGTATGVEAPPLVEPVLAAPGRPLDEGTRSFMEARFGHDFSTVRIHTGAEAGASADAVGARAYTVGADVVFGAGEYAPDTEAGRWLLAHELTHVLQQGHGDGPGSGTVQRNRVNYIEQLEPDDCAPYLARYDDSVNQVERQIQGITGPEAADLTDALARLRELRREGRVSCWRISGGLFYASYDNATDNLRLHVNVGNAAGSPTTLVHEAIHAVHGARYPRLRRMYGEALAAGGTSDRRLGILFLKWKAWTEYWAYRRQAEFNNLRQDPEHRVDAHRSAMERRDVRGSIARVRNESGEEFQPWEWEPPARFRAPARRRRRRRQSPSAAPPSGASRRPAPQPKLRVNRPGDRWEREADRVADRVMRMDPPATAPAAPPPLGAAPAGVLQRTERCHPFNGVVRRNAYPDPIRICVDGVVSSRPAGWTSDPGGIVWGLPPGHRCGEDIDHVQDPDDPGRWCKIGAGNVEIDRSGTISGCKCWVREECGHC